MHYANASASILLMCQLGMMASKIPQEDPMLGISTRTRSRQAKTDPKLGVAKKPSSNESAKVTKKPETKATTEKDGGPPVRMTQQTEAEIKENRKQKKMHKVLTTIMVKPAGSRSKDVAPTAKKSAKPSAKPSEMHPSKSTNSEINLIGAPQALTIGQSYYLTKEGFGFQVHAVPHNTTKTTGWCASIGAHYMFKHFGKGITLGAVKKKLKMNPQQGAVLEHLAENGLGHKWRRDLQNSRAGILKHAGAPLIAFADYKYDGEEEGETEIQGHVYCYFAESKQLIDSDQHFQILGAIPTSATGSKKQGKKLFEIFAFEDVEEKEKPREIDISNVYEIFLAPPSAPAPPSEESV